METAAADNLARGQWASPLFRAVLREAGPALADGILARVLVSAATVLEDPAGADRPEAVDSLVRLRLLVDIIADAP